MQTHTESDRMQPVSKAAGVDGCVHGRLVEDVLTGHGQRSGKVRCLECGAQFEDRDHRKR